MHVDCNRSKTSVEQIVIDGGSSNEEGSRTDYFRLHVLKERGEREREIRYEIL